MGSFLGEILLNVVLRVFEQDEPSKEGNQFIQEGRMLDHDIHRTESGGCEQHHVGKEDLRDDIRDNLGLDSRFVRRGSEIFLEIPNQVEASGGCHKRQNQTKVGTFAESDESEVPDDRENGRENHYERRQANFVRSGHIFSSFSQNRIVNKRNYIKKDF